jgi:gamma-glutamylcyclotransferase
MTGPLYFAYGSNLHPRRLRERVASAVAVGSGRLEGHRLRFHKRARDGSGKCDAMRTGRPEDAVLGVLYRLDAADVARLSGIEGVGRGYEVYDVRIRVGDGLVEAFTYLADPAFVDPTLVPWDWYKTLVLVGARHHRLAERYVAAIGAVESRPDPDAHRAATHAALLARIAGGSEPA